MVYISLHKRNHLILMHFLDVNVTFTGTHVTLTGTHVALTGSNVTLTGRLQCLIVTLTGYL